MPSVNRKKKTEHNTFMNRKFTSRLAENTFINREFASRPEKLNANTFMNRNSS